VHQQKSWAVNKNDGLEKPSFHKTSLFQKENQDVRLQSAPLIPVLEGQRLVPRRAVAKRLLARQARSFDTDDQPQGLLDYDLADHGSQWNRRYGEKQ